MSDGSPNLPIEIVQHIFAQLTPPVPSHSVPNSRPSTSALLAVCLASRAFYHAALPLLYRTVVLARLQAIFAFFRTLDKTEHGDLVRSLSLGAGLYALSDLGHSARADRLRSRLGRLPWLLPRLEVFSAPWLKTSDVFHPPEELVFTELIDEDSDRQKPTPLQGPLGFVSVFLACHTPWSASLVELNLPHAKLGEQDTFAELLALPSAQGLLHTPRALKTLNLAHSDAGDALVTYLLTSPQYSNLVDLNLRDCGELRDVGPLLRLAFTGVPSASNGDKSIGTDWAPHVSAKLQRLDIQGTFLLDVDDMQGETEDEGEGGEWSDVGSWIDDEAESEDQDADEPG